MYNLCMRASHAAPASQLWAELLAPVSTEEGYNVLWTDPTSDL